VNARVQALIDRLHLSPHPEGGFYRQTYRSASMVRPDDGRPPRRSLTTIYFLLDAAQHSRWHRVRSDEAWHFYEGDPTELLLLDPACENVASVRLGPVDAGERAYVVPAGWWQAARPTGDYSLVGCTVAPGFEFDDFDFLRDDRVSLEALGRLRPDLVTLA
jgi:predicted cupin superfamily sugar epimerase